MGRQDDGTTTVEFSAAAISDVVGVCIIIPTDPVYSCKRLCMDLYDCDINGLCMLAY